jgi:tetratricopeptide (TPR) repeat protein
MRRVLKFCLAASMLVGTTPARAAWQEAKSKHFIIVGDTDPNELGAYAQKLERFDQAVRMARGMNDPALADSGKLRIYFLKSANQLIDLTGGYGILGQYIGRASGSYAFVSKIKGKDERDFNSDIVFFHEYAHHLMLQNWAAALPTWFVEGFAEFLGTAKINDDGSVVLGGALNHRAYSVHANQHDLYFTEMLGGTPRGLTAWQMEIMYARGWLLTHYLTFEPSRRGQLDRYIAGIQQGQNGVDAARSAFGDLRKLENELDKYANAKEITGVVIRPDPAKVGTVSVRALSPAEAKLVPIRMRSDYGVSEQVAGIVAGKARRLAEQYPNDPFAQSVLAEAEYDADNYDASEQAADRALAANPNYVHALIYKGRAEMARAKKAPASVDWNKVRAFFAKANRLDTENAEPLMLYYRTFKEAKAAPTPSAVNGLLYAVVLAPQDNYLRWLAVRQLVMDNRLKEAKQLIAPMAFEPHSDRNRTVADQVLAAIDAGDSTKALGVIEEHEKK